MKAKPTKKQHYESLQKYLNKIGADTHFLHSLNVLYESNAVTDKPEPPKVKGRADTIDKKIAFLLRMFDLWRAYPELRFGQLLACVNIEFYGKDLFCIEDEELILELEKFYKEKLNGRNE